MAGDWNCTEDLKLDKSGEEPHFKSALVLSNLVEECDLNDVQTNRNNESKQYTWIKTSDSEGKGTILGRIYQSISFNNRVMEAASCGFSDHQRLIDETK